MISFENFVTRSKLNISAYLAANKITSDDALRDYCLANNIVPPHGVYFPEKKENKAENESSNAAAKVTKPKVKKPRVVKPQASNKVLAEEKAPVKNTSLKRKSKTTRKRTSKTTKTPKK